MPTKSIDTDQISDKTKELLMQLINNGVENLDIVTAYKLNQTEIEIILKQLFSKSTNNIVVNNIVDKSILGGLTVKFGSYYVDYSLKGKLDEITESLDL